MPKQKRWDIKRKLDYTVKDLQAAQVNIVNVGNQFKGVHDDYYESFIAIFAAIGLVIDVVNGIRNKI